MILVGEQAIRELVLLDELAMRFRRIRADAEYDCVESLEPREGVSERARLDGSAGGVVLGIEEQHDDSTPQR
jgi:hypothetical protein